MKTLIVVATCPRPGGTSYVEETVRRLDDEGANLADRKIILSDGPLDFSDKRFPSSWSLDIHGGGQRRGTRFVFARALKLAVVEGAEHLLYFEDDVLPCKNAVRLMINFVVAPHLAFVSFFSFIFEPIKIAAGLHEFPVIGPRGRGFNGAQALLLPRRTFSYLNEQDIVGFRTSRLPLKTTESSCDRAFSIILDEAPADIPKLYAAHMPSLVEHVGNDSAAHPGEKLHRVNRHLEKRGRRTARWWPGYDFDAMTLLNNTAIQPKAS